MDNGCSVEAAYWIGNTGMGKPNMGLDFTYYLCVTWKSSISQWRCCVNKLWLQCERFFSARVSDLIWRSVWSGNLLSRSRVTPFLLLEPPRDLTIQWVREIISLDSKFLYIEMISLTHCIVKWWGGPSSKNGVTWPRFVMATSAFCLVSSQNWSVLFSMFDLSPLHHVLNWEVFLHWY